MRIAANGEILKGGIKAKKSGRPPERRRDRPEPSLFGVLSQPVCVVRQMYPCMPGKERPIRFDFFKAGI